MGGEEALCDLALQYRRIKGEWKESGPRALTFVFHGVCSTILNCLLL